MEAINTNWLGFGLVMIGIYYLIYCVSCKNRVTFRNRSYKDNIIKLPEYLKLQLMFSIINSLYLILFGVVLLIYNVNNIFFVLSPLIFDFINYLLKVVSKRKGYIV
jgi:hypothetical protein